MPETSAVAQPTATRRRRSIIGGVLLIACIAALPAAWLIAGRFFDGDRTVQMTALIATLTIAFVVQLIWWLAVAGLSWKLRIIGLGVALLTMATAAAAVRIEGFRGEMWPIFAFRWSPTAEDRAIAELERRPPRVTPTDARPQLTKSPDFSIADRDWPQFRGPERDGIGPAITFETDWSANPPQEVWRHRIGPGWSGFAVLGDRAYTQEQRGPDECVVCYDANTGDQIWVHIDAARFSETLGGDGPRATPIITEDAIVTLGATGILNCLDPATGAAFWSRDILQDAGEGTAVDNIDWGMAGSPLVRNDRIYVAPGGGRGRGVIAYDTHGKIVWANGDGPASYCAARIEPVDGVPTLIVIDGDAANGYDPQTGERFWTYPWTNQPKVNATQPVVRDGQVFLSSGYTVGSVLIEPKRADDSWKIETLWRNDNEFKLKFNDAILRDGYLYGFDEGILACYDFATGERQWKRGRYGYGQQILLGETLVVLAEDGRLVTVQATPDRFVELGSFPAIEGKTWNHIAYANGCLFVRNAEEAACFKLSGITEQEPARVSLRTQPPFAVPR